MDWGTATALSLLLTLLAQVAAGLLAFRVNGLLGLFSLVVPGYLFVALRRTRFYWPVVGAWLAGVVGVAAGTVAMA